MRAQVWKIGVWVATAVSLGVIYGPLVLRDPLTHRDDQELIEPIRSMNRLSDYWQILREHKTLDLQPLRDLSFYCDVQFFRWFGFSTFHLTNLLLWFAFLWVLGRLLKRVFSSQASLSGWMSLFAVYPLFVNSVAWVSGRKHLLAATFILLATYEVLKRRKNIQIREASLPVFFGLSLLSHPIAVLWPLWALWAVGPAHRRKPGLWVCLVLAALGGYVNWIYYRQGYVQSGGVAKIMEFEWSQISVSVLALGRSLFQVLFPAWLSTDYAIQSPQGLIGLFLWPVLGLLALRKLKGEDGPLWFAFIFIPLIPVTLRMTNIFVSDTYLVLPAVGVLILAEKCFERFRLRPTRPLTQRAVFSVFFLVFSAKAAVHARTWATDLSLWENARRVEGTPRSTVMVGLIQMENGERETPYFLSRDLNLRGVGVPGFDLLYVQSTYLNPRLDWSTKLHEIREAPFRSAWKNVFLFYLFIERGMKTEAIEALSIGFENAKKDLGKSFLPTLAALRETCRKEGLSENCP